MSQIDKLIKKLYKKPVPKDMRIDEIRRIVEHFGCETESGGKHPLKIIHKQTGTTIPIPYHGDTVKEAYIIQIKRLLERIKEEGEIN